MPYMYIYVCSSTYFVHSITAASALAGAHAAPGPLHHSPVYGRSFRPLYSLLALYRRRLCFAAAAAAAATVTNEGCGRSRCMQGRRKVLKSVVSGQKVIQGVLTENVLLFFLPKLGGVGELPPSCHSSFDGPVCSDCSSTRSRTKA